MHELFKTARIKTYHRGTEILKDEDGNVLRNENNLPYIKVEDGKAFEMQFENGLKAEIFQKSTGTEIVLGREATETESLMNWNPPRTAVLLGVTVGTQKILQVLSTLLEVLENEEPKTVYTAQFN